MENNLEEKLISSVRLLDFETVANFIIAVHQPANQEINPDLSYLNSWLSALNIPYYPYYNYILAIMAEYSLIYSPSSSPILKLDSTIEPSFKIAYEFSWRGNTVPSKNTEIKLKVNDQQVHFSQTASFYTVGRVIYFVEKLLNSQKNDKSFVLKDRRTKKEISLEAIRYITLNAFVIKDETINQGEINNRFKLERDFFTYKEGGIKLPCSDEAINDAVDFLTGDQGSFKKFKEDLKKKGSMSNFIPNAFRRYPLIRSPKDKNIIYNLFPQFFAHQICTILYWEFKLNKEQGKKNHLEIKEKEGKQFSGVFGKIFENYCQDLIKYSLQKDSTSEFCDNDEIKKILMKKYQENELPKHADGILIENNTAIFFEFKSGAVPEPQRKGEEIFKEIKEGLDQINSIKNQIENDNFKEDGLKDVNQNIGIIVGWEDFPFSRKEMESWGNIKKQSFEWMYISVSVFEVMTSLKRKGWQYKELFNFLMKLTFEDHSVGEIQNGPAYLTMPDLIRSLNDQYGDAFNQCYTYKDFIRYTDHLIDK